MKNAFTYISILAATVIVFATPAYAASVDTSVVKTSGEVGSTVTVRYTLDPDGTNVYTLKLAMYFQPDKLKLVSFSYAQGWIALAQPGYDETDNVAGSFIKTAGYPKGVLSPTLFGTATFKVLKSGTTTVQLSDDAFALDAVNKDVLNNPGLATTLIVPAKPRPANLVPSSSPSRSPSALFDVTVMPGAEHASTSPLWMFVLITFVLMLYLVFRYLRRMMLRRNIKKISKRANVE